MKFLPLVVVVLISFGCTSTSSVGDKMVDRGKAAKKIGKEWNKGERMLRKGEQYISKSEKLMTEGQQLIEEGRRLMSENEDAYSRAFDKSESR